MLRLAIANIYRPGALTPSVVMSLGLGLAVLVTITQIERQSAAASSCGFADRARLRSISPIFPAPKADRFGAFLKQTAPQSTGRGTCRCCAAASSAAPRSSGRKDLKALIRLASGCCRAIAA
jgi:hypothetical protein